MGRGSRVPLSPTAFIFSGPSRTSAGSGEAPPPFPGARARLQLPRRQRHKGGLCTSPQMRGRAPGPARLAQARAAERRALRTRACASFRWSL